MATVHCLYCGAHIADDHAHCPHCGAISHFQQRGEMAGGRRRFYLFFLLVVVVCVLAIVWLPR